jgi:23S rRNA pseudouridine2605 synthase
MVMERLQKILARAGLGSRRACEQFILQGRVEVDGRVLTELGSKADLEKQEVCLDGEPVWAESSAHYLLYKPRGYICSLRAERGKPRAVDLISDQRRLYTVGRLDEDSEGLIVVTNDGELTQKLTHPSYGVAKEYLVTIDGLAEARALRRLRSGVHLAEGRTAPAEVKVLRRGGRSELSVRITEGLNRQVRRMLAAVGLEVRKLVRVRIGPLAMRDLKPGRSRRLADAEVRALLAAASRGKKAAAKAKARSKSKAAGDGEASQSKKAPARHRRSADDRKPIPKMTNREKQERRKEQRRAEGKAPPRKGRQRRGKSTGGSKVTKNSKSPRRGKSTKSTKSAKSARGGKSTRGNKVPMAGKSARGGKRR